MMGEGKGKPISVRIMDSDYTVTGNVDEEYTKEIARYVDQKMREIAEKLSYPSSAKVAILAALNIADELFDERKTRSQLMEELTRRARAMAQSLEQRLSTAP
jgi:cell division protein ZapA